MKWQKIIWLIPLLSLVGGFGYLFYHRIGKLRELRKQQYQHQAKVDMLQVEVSQLTKEIDGLESDPGKLEKLAREKLGLVGKNEKIFIIEPTPVPVEE